jgi:hypothetical protein
VEADMLLFDGSRDLGSLAKEVEILAYRPWSYTGSVAKGIIIEGIASLLQLIAQAIVRLLKFKSIPVVVATRQPGEGIMGLGKASSGRIVAIGIEAEERHGCSGRLNDRARRGRVTIEIVSFK